MKHILAIDRPIFFPQPTELESWPPGDLAPLPRRSSNVPRWPAQRSRCSVAAAQGLSKRSTMSSLSLGWKRRALPATLGPCP